MQDGMQAYHQNLICDFGRRWWFSTSRRVWSSAQDPGTNTLEDMDKDGVERFRIIVFFDGRVGFHFHVKAGADIHRRLLLCK